MPELMVALCGLGAGLGGTLLFTGIRGTHAPAFRRSVWCLPRPQGPTPWRWPLAALAGSAVWLVTRWPVAGMAVAGLTVFMPWLLSAGTLAARRIERLDALEDWLRHLADTLGPGTTGLVSAMQGSARDAPAAIATEVVTLAQRLQTWDIQTALLAFADDIHDQIGDTAAAGLCVAYQQGAGITDLLTTLAGQVADDVTARRNTQAERARRRSTARTLLALWGLMFLGFAVFGTTTYTAVYRSAAGQLVLTLVLGLVVVSMVWLRRLGVEPSSPRFLTSAGRGHR